MAGRRAALPLALSMRDEVERRLAARGIDAGVLPRDEVLLAVWPHACKLVKVRERESRMRRGRKLARRMADDAAARAAAPARGADDAAARAAAWWAGAPGGTLCPLDLGAWRVALVPARDCAGAGREAV